MFLHRVGTLTGNRNLRDREHDMLFLPERKRFERPQQTVLENSFQMLRHHLILPMSAPGERQLELMVMLEIVAARAGDLARRWGA